MNTRQRSDVDAARVEGPDGFEHEDDEAVAAEDPPAEPDPSEPDEVTPPKTTASEADDVEADAIQTAEPVDAAPADGAPEDEVPEAEAPVAADLPDEPAPADVPEVPEEAMAPEPEVPAPTPRERARPASGAVSAAVSAWITDRDGHRMRWDAIQIGFVDQPRMAVQDADALVADIVEQLTTAVTDARTAITGLWQDDRSSSTEDLRLAFQQYRELFDRLLDTR